MQLPGVKANSVYRLDLAMLSVDLIIRDKEGKFLNANSVTGLANNGLNSLFNRSSLYLNNVPVNQSSLFHNYKSYLHQLISLSRMEKACIGRTTGFIYATGSQVDDFDVGTNPSFAARRAMWGPDFKKTVRLCGLIYHDLVISMFYIMVNLFYILINFSRNETRQVYPQGST